MPPSNPPHLHFLSSLLLFSLLLSTAPLPSLSQSGVNVLTEYPDCVSGPLSKFPICDQSLPEVTRALDIVSRLNSTEKIIRIGEAYGGNKIDRIGLPTYHWRQNACHGLSGGVIWTNATQDYSNSTNYPHVIGLAATFDRDLWLAMAQAISDEARAFANVGRAGLDWFGPNINLYRDPRWGRGQEVAGEDPYLLAVYAVQFVTGLQVGEDSRYIKNVAECKHYAGYDVDGPGPAYRAQYNANISNLDLVETYLPAFESCVKDAHVGSIMCSYNGLNGVPACANSFLLQTILRENWQWDPYNWVVSDCGAIDFIYQNHHYTKTEEETVRVALLAGTDISCGAWYSEWGLKAYQQGLINDTHLDRALVRQFVSLIRMGYFDDPTHQPYRHINKTVIGSPAHADLALQAGLESLVLLKNEGGALPLGGGGGGGLRVALIGPSSNATDLFLGSYDGPSPRIMTIMESMERSGANVNVTCVKGADVNSTRTAGFAAAVAAAAVADVVVYVGGLDQSIEAEVHDRVNITLPGLQPQLLDELMKATKKPIILVIVSGGQVDLTTWKNSRQVGAIIWAGYPGQRGGEAIAAVLLGRFSPSGRLPVTQYPADYINEVPMTDQSMRPSAHNPGRTYKFYTGEAVYPFGHGLSYSTFTYTQSDNPPHSSLPTHYSITSLAPSALQSDRNADIAFWLTVTNTGQVVSDVSALAFLSSNASYAGVSPPLKELFDFAHVRGLRPGQSVSVFFELAYRELAHVDHDGHAWLLPGEYEVSINNEREWSYGFVLEGEPVCIKTWPGGGPPIHPAKYGRPQEAMMAVSS